MKLKSLTVASLALCLLSSCSTKPSKLVYFKDIDTTTPAVVIAPESYITTIQPDDELLITVNTPANPIVSSSFNLPQTNPAPAKEGASLQTQPQNQTYVVNSQGDIDFPELGKIHVAGLTTEQLKEKLTTDLSKWIKEPVIMVRIVNFTIDVAGEVKEPGRYPVSRQRFSVLDALSAAGDLTEYGERQNVLLIREENGKRVHHSLDLTSADILSSPYFYVHQNDYIYVEPNQIRQDNSKYNQNNAFKLSVVSTIVSGVSVIASLIIALAIK